jgi:hypothetical protein
MGCCFSAQVSGFPPITIAIFGLNRSGKSTVFRSLVPLSATSLPPTALFDCASFIDAGTVITLCDFHFDPSAWKTEYPKLSGVLFVVDGSDPDRVPQSVRLLTEIQCDRAMSGKPCVVFVNKSDLCVEKRFPSTVKVFRGSADDALAYLVAKILRKTGRLVIDSVIVGELPEIFNEFRGKEFELLWRGSRDGFEAEAFHGRCDGRRNVLVIIEDTDGNVFGGFTPVPFDSEKGCRADVSLESFLFTLKNPHQTQPQSFSLRPEKSDRAICCFPTCGPDFCDITVSDNCNLTGTSYSRFFDATYKNDSGVRADRFFTGSEWFTVKEIEVFETTE